MKLRPFTREERQLAFLWGVVVASVSVLRPFWLALAPLMPACPFRQITGIPCPSCGSTHAAVALIHGRLGVALAANPLTAVAAVVFLVGGLVAPLWAAMGWPVPNVPAPLPRWTRTVLATGLLVEWAYLIMKNQ